MEMDFNDICHRFAHILNGKGESKNGSCSVSFHRSFDVKMLG